MRKQKIDISFLKDKECVVMFVIKDKDTYRHVSVRFTKENLGETYFNKEMAGMLWRDNVYQLLKVK